MISKDTMADILDEIAEAIRTNNAESISHRARQLRENARINRDKHFQGSYGDGYDDGDAKPGWKSGFFL